MNGAEEDDVLMQIEMAFLDVPRPPNDDLLHPQCHDDMDLEALYAVDDWRRMPDDLVESEYAALAFLSADGFRYFIPAYLLWVLRHPDSSAAVVDATVWAFHADLHGDLAPFVRSKWALLDDDQRDAVRAFLEVMVDHHPDGATALAAWR